MNRFLKVLMSLTLINIFSILPVHNGFNNISNSIVISAMSDEDLDKVIQQNIDKMEKINSYTSEFVVDYVTPSRDYNEVVDTLNKIQELSNNLCDGIFSDYDKIKILHDYVSDNVYYDFVAKEDFANLETISLKNVLENKRTICAGYSNFFSALCNAQGIYCVNIRGSAKTFEVPDISQDNAPTNHEWTAVWLESENRWVYVDCTWDSTNRYYSDDDIVTNAHVDTYFDISVEDISKNHKAKIVDYRNFFDALTYFDTQIVTTETSIIEDAQIDSLVETTITSVSQLQVESSTTATKVSNLETTSTIKETTQIEETIKTAENTVDISKNIITIFFCMVISLICAIITRKSLKD